MSKYKKNSKQLDVKKIPLTKRIVALNGVGNCVSLADVESDLNKIKNLTKVA